MVPISKFLITFTCANQFLKFFDITIMETALSSTSGMLFTSMGMFIIDEIHYGDADSDPSDRKTFTDVIGGAGTYGALGSRFFLSSPNLSKQVGWIVDVGSDFPPSIMKQIKSWNTGVVLRDTPDRLTTRGWNHYGFNEEREFRYTTEKVRIVVEDLIQNIELLASVTFHLICSPLRCTNICTALIDARKDADLPTDHVIFWEPVPGVCSPEDFQDCITTLKYVDIVSPNALEAAMFFGLPEPSDEAGVQLVALKFLVHMTKPWAAVIIRCGKKGCAIFSHKKFPYSRPCLGADNSSMHYAWFPAYHNPKFPDYCVEDPTGGGNAFIGGAAAGYVLGRRSLVRAAVYGSVAASVAIEQVGVPEYGSDNAGRETWNGTLINSRVENYCNRYNIDY